MTDQIEESFRPSESESESESDEVIIMRAKRVSPSSCSEIQHDLEQKKMLTDGTVPNYIVYRFL